MAGPLAARSISRPIWEILRSSPPAVRVWAVFQHACHLLTAGGELIALVTPDVGNGPLNIVVGQPDSRMIESAAAPAEPAGFGTLGLERGTRGSLSGSTLQIGRLMLDLSQAAPWEPCPDWAGLRSRRAEIALRLEQIVALARREAPLESCWGAGGYLSSTVQAGIGWLREGWEGSPSSLREAALHLAGLGVGLTPAGDDLLCGAMLWAWIAHPWPRNFCGTLAEAGAPRTTLLSAALLRAAARGECSEAWHDLLAGLTEADPQLLERAVHEVLAHGATSGADALAGFLSLGLAEFTP